MGQSKPNSESPDILLGRIERAGRRYRECMNGWTDRLHGDLHAELAELGRASEELRAAVTALAALRPAH